MPRIAIRSVDRSAAVPVTAKDGSSAGVEAVPIFEGERHPIHLHLYRLAAGGTLDLPAGSIDRLAYVWQGNVVVADQVLPQGSSLVLERGASLIIEAGEEPAQIVVFAPAASAIDPGQPKPKGRVRLMPVDRVARFDPLPGSGVSGGMHFGSDSPTCRLWLHENTLPANPEPTRQQMQDGVHSHTEDEIIFVTSGAIRLGGKLHGPGTAIAVASGTLYGFTAGPEGMTFINFRDDKPLTIRWADGRVSDEVEFFKERLGAFPEPLDLI